MGCKVGEKIIRWDSTKYTTEVMSTEIYRYLCNKRKRTQSYFQNEVKRLISKGPLTNEELKYVKCGCLNKSEVKGECVLGACVEIRTNGWTVSINVETETPIGSAADSLSTGAIPYNTNAVPTNSTLVAPPGYHYMPDGSLMRDSDMPSSGGGNYTNTGNNTGAGAGTSSPSGY